MKRGYFIAILGATLLIGVVLGRLSVGEKKTVETKEVVKYKCSTVSITDTIFKPKPYNVYISDTIHHYLTQVEKVDTAAILRDYYLTRQYDLDFSNDTLGEFRVKAEVNQNRLFSVNSYIKPIIKTICRETSVIKYETRGVQPFVLVGTSPKLDLQKITVGIDLSQRYIVGVSGLRWDSKYNYAVEFGVKF